MPRVGDDVEIRRLDEGDLEAYLLLRDTSFGYPAGEDVRRRLAGRLPRTWGAFAGGTLAASLTAHRLDVFVSGRPEPLAGIGAVQTLPEHRRGGLAARLMRQALEEARSDGIGWSSLYPFDPRFYARYGWQGLPTGVRLEFPLESLPPRDVPADLARVRGDLRDALQELRLRCLRSWSFANARTRGTWDVWEDLLPEPGKRGTAYRTERAYVVVQQEWDQERGGSRLTVLDAASHGRAGRDDLLGILGTFRGQAHVGVIDVPSDDPLAWDWSSWYASRTRTTYMARAVDVPAALSSLRAARVSSDGDGAAGDEPLDLPAFTCRFRDAFAPWNDGCFRVTPSPGGCAVEPASSADATLDVRALPLLASGAAGPDAVRRAGLAEGDPTVLATLAALSGGVTPLVAPADGF